MHAPCEGRGGAVVVPKHLTLRTDHRSPLDDLDLSGKMDS